MESFSQEIISATSRFHFLFHKMKTPTGLKFFVACTAAGRRQSLFTMEQKGADWQIVNAPKVTDEIMRLQPRLSTLIKDHL